MMSRILLVGLVLGSSVACKPATAPTPASQPAPATDACGGQPIEQCVPCAMEGECRATMDACGAAPACVALDACLRPCHEADDEEVCAQQCADDYPDGVPLLDATDACLERVCLSPS